MGVVKILEGFAMRLATLLVFFLGACTAAFTGETTSNDHDLALMQGTWTMTAGEDNGHEIPADVRHAARLTIHGDHYSVHVGPKNTEGTQKIDASATPRTIDAIDQTGDHKGQVMLGIYEINEHEFKVCFAKPGQPRPHGFDAKAGSGQFIHHWEKSKEAAE
jgi:uncharacterized protein (TIGR03067 family)